jgi:DNA topoisomerase-3
MVAGRVKLADFLNIQTKFVSDLCNTAGVLKIREVQQTGPACPNCNKGILRMKTGKKGKFWGCSRYPECKTSYDDNKGLPDMK